MKTFEEKWTAWIDDQLTGQELIDFEASLPDKAVAEAEKRQARQLGTLLKRELGAQMLTNEDFFSHQLRQRIAEEIEDPSRSESEEEASPLWTIRRLFWAGAAALAAVLVLAVFIMPDEKPAGQSDYFTELTKTQIDPRVSPNATFTVFQAKEDRVTVLWTEGLKTLPADYAAK